MHNRTYTKIEIQENHEIRNIYTRTQKITEILQKSYRRIRKRLSRYCKISCKFVKKEKEWNSLLTKDTGMKKLLVQPGKAELTSEKLSDQLKKWEGSGMKGVMFFVPEWNEEATDKFAELGTGPIEPLVFSDFTMSSNMTGMVLYEQIYRGYRILHNHPYHK